MTAQTATRLSSTTFTPDERRKLHEIRRRYMRVRDTFSQRELQRLRFLRYLYETERLSS